jgi:microcystin-dependent protein
MPQLITVERNSIVSPAIGLMIYNKDKYCMETYVGNSRWLGTVPAGTIEAFAGEVDSIPPGWILCDGRTLDANLNPMYMDLFKAIKNYWGGTNYTNFNIPDLRGVFLRGVNGSRTGTFADPDLAGRTKADGTTDVGGVVGSYQVDGIRQIRVLLPLGGIECNGWSAGGSTTTIRGSSTGGGYLWKDIVEGNETRPKNAYVNYIIKY